MSIDAKNWVPRKKNICCLYLIVVSLLIVINTRVAISQAQEAYTLDFVIDSYATGQVRAIVTHGTDLVPSSDGAYIYARSDGIYRVSDGEFLGEFSGARFSPDGTHFAQPNVGVYRLADMSLRFATPHLIKFSPDGIYFAAQTDGVYQLPDLVRVLHIPNATFEFSDDSQLVATSEGKVYQLSDVDRFIEIPGIQDGTVPFISSDGKFAWARNATLVRVDSGKVISLTSDVVQFTSDGRWAVVHGMGIFDLVSDPPPQNPTISLIDVSNVMISPLGKYYATPEGVFELPNGNKIINSNNISVPEFTFAPDDTTIVIRGNGLYSLETSQLLHVLSSFGDYHATGRYISTDNRIVRTVDGSVIFEKGGERLPTLNISPDGSLVAFIRDGVYDLSTREKLFSINGFPDTFSVDTDYLAVRGREETAIYRIFDGQRYEGLEPIYTERGLLSVGQVVFVVDSSEQQLSIPFIRVSQEQRFYTSPELESEIRANIPEGLYLTVLETTNGWVRVKYGESYLWSQVDPKDVLWLPNLQ